MSGAEKGGCVGCDRVRPDGSIRFTYSRGCGISINTVGPLHLESAFPEVSDKIDSCEGPAEKQVRHSGLLGLLGLKEARVVCGAVTDEDLRAIIQDQIEWDETLQARGER